MSNVDQVKQSQGTFWHLKAAKSKVDEKLQIALGTILSLKVEASEASTSYWKAKAKCRENQTKLRDYRTCIGVTNITIKDMREDLGDNVVDAFLASEEFYNTQAGIFDRAVEEVNEIFTQAYPNLDLSNFNSQLKKTMDSRENREVSSFAHRGYLVSICKGYTFE
ncbi:hypothetical protein Q3G72_023946 [Acer saccharum]|nr:hypothetical protein Q3G72_023946 [Acer saccharum]